MSTSIVGIAKLSVERRSFTLADQLAFAAISGDFNPLHVDPQHARRTLVGVPLVHGVHAVLWALDRWFASTECQRTIRRLVVVFRRPLPVGRELTVGGRMCEDGTVLLEIMVDGECGVQIDCALADEPVAPSVDVADSMPAMEGPRELGQDDVALCSGHLPLHLPMAQTAALFPHLVRCLPHHQVAMLLAATRLVGMECPGAQSIFSELQLEAGTVDATQQMSFKVKRFDKRFGLVRLAVEGVGLSGTIEAFLRPRQQAQPSMAECTQLVSPQEFANQRAVVLGGSRGLGEVVAKVLATGGAAVDLSYHHGEDDAQRVVREISAAGGSARCFHYDVLEQAADETSVESWRSRAPTHLYYMATPMIAAGHHGAFRTELFERYIAYYVDGFAAAYAHFTNPALRFVFFPSTVFVDDMPAGMGEYLVAKQAGETLGAFLTRQEPSVQVVCPRLPRMATDQTVGLSAAERPTPLPIMLQLLRQYAGAAR